MRAKLLNLLVGLGIQPMVDKKTGQLVVDFKSMRDALGLSEAEAMAAIRRGDLLRTKRSDLDPMN